MNDLNKEDYNKEKTNVKNISSDDIKFNGFSRNRTSSYHYNK